MPGRGPRTYARPAMSEPVTVRVAALQATPAILDAPASVDKAVALMGEAAQAGAQLAVLPETFVPLYPSNAWAKGAAAFGGWDDLWERLHANAVDVPGPLVDRLVAACRRHRLHLAIGINEREGGSLYNTLLYLGPEGLLHRHRKLMPTMHERLFHGVGAGDDLAPVDLPFARVGGLICWENRMPLARWAVYEGSPQAGSRPRPTTPMAGSRRCGTSRSSRGRSSSRSRSTSRPRPFRTTSRCRFRSGTRRSGAAAPPSSSRPGRGDCRPALRRGGHGSRRLRPARRVARQALVRRRRPLLAARRARLTAPSGAPLLAPHEPLVLLSGFERAVGREQADRRRVRRIDVDEVGDVGELAPVVDRQRELMDHLRRVRRENVRAHDPLAVGDDHDRTLRRAVGARPVGVDQVLAPDLDVVGAEPLLGLARGQSGVGELRIGEGAPRDEVGHPALSGKEHVAHRSHSLVSGHVGEQVPAGDVAHGVDRVDLRARPVVDQHTVAVEPDPEALQAEAVDVRPPAGADEDLGALPAALLAVLRPVDHLLAVFGLHAPDVHAQAHVNALPHDAVVQDRDEVGLVARKDPVPVLQDGHRDSQPAEGLGQLHRDRARPDEG